MNSKDEKSTANKSKQEQVKKMIDDFFKSDDEDDEEDDVEEDKEEEDEEEDDEEGDDKEEEDGGGGVIDLAAHVNVNSLRELYKSYGRHINVVSSSLYSYNFSNISCKYNFNVNIVSLISYPI